MIILKHTSTDFFYDNDMILYRNIIKNEWRFSDVDAKYKI